MRHLDGLGLVADGNCPPCHLFLPIYSVQCLQFGVSKITQDLVQR